MPPPASCRLSHEQSLFCGQSCQMLYRELGLASVLRYLFVYLQQFYPISRIFCGFRHVGNTQFIPVADTLPSGLTTTQTLAGRSITPEQMRKLLVRDDLKPYILNGDPFPDSPHAIMRQEDFISHLRVPLFALDAASCQLGFCSTTPDTFQQCDADMFMQLTAPLGTAMKGELRMNLRGEFSPLSRSRLGSAALLRMCEGLSRLRADMDQVAPTDCTVLIEGETGVGKDLVAEAVHEGSARRGGPLVRINCGALSESLLESELFGHEKGSFTGATTTRMGYFETASGGTIFLDEIGELTPRGQVELLRTLDNREIMRVGSSKDIPIDIRVIAATNRDLRAMVKNGTFRADLWFRINMFPLKVPPLRQRRMDIAFLVRHFTDGLAAQMSLAAPPAITEKQMEVLYRHNWPGNIRELRNVVARAIIRARSGSACLPLVFELEDEASVFAPDGILGLIDSVNREAAPVVPDNSTPSTPQLPQEDFLPTLEQWGQHYVDHVLARTRGRIGGVGGCCRHFGRAPQHSAGQEQTK